MKCYLNHEVYKKLQYYIKHCDYEISGLGKTHIQDGDVYVDDLICFKQEVTGATTDLDYDDRAKVMFKLKKSGENLENWNLWWHSHVNMGVFWSTTDEEAISNDIGKIPFHLSIVGNKKGELLTRVDVVLNPAKEGLEIGCLYHTVDKIETIISKPFIPNDIMEQINQRELEIMEIEDSIKNQAKRIKELREESENIINSFSEYPDLEEEVKKEIKEKVTNPSKQKYSYDYSNWGKKYDDYDDYDIYYYGNYVYNEKGEILGDREAIANKESKKNSLFPDENDIDIDGIIFNNTKGSKKKDSTKEVNEDENFPEKESKENIADDIFYYRRLRISANKTLNTK